MNRQKTITRRGIQHLAQALLCGLVVSALATPVPATLLLSEDFESPSFTADTSIGGINGWIAPFESNTHSDTSGSPDPVPVRGTKVIRPIYGGTTTTYAYKSFTTVTSGIVEATFFGHLNDNNHTTGGSPKVGIWFGNTDPTLTTNGSLRLSFQNSFTASSTDTRFTYSWRNADGSTELATQNVIVPGVTRSDWYELRIQYNRDTNTASWDYRLDGLGAWVNIDTHVGAGAALSPAQLFTEMLRPSGANGNSPVMDDIAVNTVVIPEPAGLAVLGIVSVAAFSRRRRMR